MAYEVEFSSEPKTKKTYRAWDDNDMKSSDDSKKVEETNICVMKNHEGNENNI